MNLPLDYDSIKNFGFIVLLDIGTGISTASSIVAFLVGLSMLALNLKKLFKKEKAKPEEENE